MKAFKAAVGVFALIPLLTGLGDIVLGVSVWQGLGVNLSKAAFHDPVLDSQVRFMATIWFGYGVLLCACLRDVERHNDVLKWALGFALLGGIARVISIVDVGMPQSTIGTSFVLFALVVEFIAVPMLLFWQHKLVGGTN